MAVAALVIFLAGLVTPILLILVAVLFDLGVLLWYLHRRWTDRWAPGLWQFVARHAPVAHRPGHASAAA